VSDATHPNPGGAGALQSTWDDAADAVAALAGVGLLNDFIDAQADGHAGVGERSLLVALAARDPTTLAGMAANPRAAVDRLRAVAVAADAWALQHTAFDLDAPPRAAQRAIDAIWAASARGARDDEAWQVLSGWIVAHWWDGGPGENFDPDDGIITAAMPPHRQEIPTDDDVRDHLELDDDDTVDDDMRAATARAQLEQPAEDADVSPLLARVDLTTSDGVPLVIVGKVSGYSFSGVDVDLAGPWTTWEAAQDAYERAGWILSLDAFAELPAAVQLQWLRGEARNTSRPARQSPALPVAIQHAVDVLALASRMA